MPIAKDVKEKMSKLIAKETEMKGVHIFAVLFSSAVCNLKETTSRLLW